MNFTVFKELFSRAGPDGSRSTALQSLHWMIVSILGALLIGAWLEFHWLLLVTFALILIGFVCLFGYSYYFLLHENLDALRSETYSLKKMSIEKGITGDSTQGVFEPDEKNQAKLTSTDPERSNNET